MSCHRMAAVAALALACGGCSREAPAAADIPGSPLPAGVRVPLTDMGTRTYLTFSGGLYPNGSNVMPLTHAAAGNQRAAAIRTRDASGTPSAAGKYVLLSIGMSNTTQEFSAFITLAGADAAVDHARLAIVDGAAGGKTSDFWTAPAGAEYERVKSQVLLPRGLGEAQVAAVWLKVANAGPTRSLPDAAADAYQLVGQQGEILRALRVRYPNLQQVYVSSRIYAGYATTTLNPEPYAYESGFAAKWLVQAQIAQMSGGAPDARAGDLDYTRVAPWVAWGAYLWADGATARADGLAWSPADLSTDGTHPSTTGRTKVATLLLDFLKSSPQSSCWFLAGRQCP